MILVDTSVWADHFRHGDPMLGDLLGAGQVTMHPFVIGELALGNLHQREATLRLLLELPVSPVVPAEVFLETSCSAGLVTGIGFVDAHLLLSARAVPGTDLWTRDKKLAVRADALGVGWRGAT